MRVGIGKCFRLVDCCDRWRNPRVGRNRVVKDGMMNNERVVTLTELLLVSDRYE